MYCSFMWLPCFSWLLITEFYIFYSWKLEILWNCFPLKIPSWPLEQCTATSSSRVCLKSRQTWYLTIQKLLFAVFHFLFRRLDKLKSWDITLTFILLSGVVQCLLTDIIVHSCSISVCENIWHLFFSKCPEETYLATWMATNIILASDLTPHYRPHRKTCSYSIKKGCGIGLKTSMQMCIVISRNFENMFTKKVLRTFHVPLLTSFYIPPSDLTSYPITPFLAENIAGRKIFVK